MGNYALVKDGKVINRIVADADFIDKIRGDYDLITDATEAVKGASWDGTNFTPPEPQPVPEPVETLKDKVDAIFTKIENIEAKIGLIDTKTDKLTDIETKVDQLTVASETKTP